MGVFGAWGWETLVFRAATAVALVHALDDAFLNRQPGVDLDQHALAAVIALAVGIGAIVAFPRLRPGFRAAIAFVFGVLAATNGSMHVIHIAKDGPAHSDVTGALAMVAGLVPHRARALDPVASSRRGRDHSAPALGQSSGRSRGWRSGRLRGALPDSDGDRPDAQVPRADPRRRPAATSR